MFNIGDRIGAIKSADSTTVHLFGYGVFEGYKKHPELGQNPRIKLDNGKIIWGFECWWSAKNKIIAAIGTRKIVKVK